LVYDITICAVGRGCYDGGPLGQTNTHNASLACNQAECLAVWVDGEDGAPGSIEGSFIDANGHAMVPLPIGFASTNRISPRAGGPQVTWDGERFLLIWPDSLRGTDVDIVGMYVERDHTRGPRFTIAASARDEQRPFIATAGTGRSLVGYEIADQTTSQIAGRFVSLHAPPLAPRRRP
jgi:hypothetical protein